MNEIVALIERVGFPIVLILIIIFLFKDSIGKYFTTMLEEQRKDKEALKDELKFNREVSTELLRSNETLLRTNETLAKDVVSKVDNLSSKIDTFINKK